MREAIRRLLLEGDDLDTAALAPKVRQLVDDGVMTARGGQVAARLYGYGGIALLDRELDLLLHGRMLLWQGLLRIGNLLTHPAPYRFESDLVGRIAFRELDYAAEPDGLPLDPAVALREIMPNTAAFEAEPYDLVAEMPKFNWPTVVISGGRDLVTPPAVAERIASLVPNAVLVKLPTLAHGALDSREPAALAIAGAVCRGEFDGLAERGQALDALPPRPALRLLVEGARRGGGRRGRTADAAATSGACGYAATLDPWCCALESLRAIESTTNGRCRWEVAQRQVLLRGYACGRSDYPRMNPIAV